MDSNQAIPKTPLDTVVFRETVPVAFSFLMAEYGFTLAQENECLFTARSDVCIVRIYLEWGDVVVTLQPLGPHQVEGLRTPHRELGLAIILARLDPKVELPTGLITKPEEFGDRIHQLATLLRTYCAPLLKGNFSDWPRFETYAETIAAAWEKEQKKLVKDTNLGRVRAKAEVAFREHAYATAINLYESIRKHLTPVELKKIEYARKQLGDRETRGRAK